MKRPTERERAKERLRPYYKKSTDYKRACPFCDAFLKPIYGGTGYSCNCGDWQYDYVSGELVFEPTKDDKERK